MLHLTQIKLSFEEKGSVIEMYFEVKEEQNYTFGREVL